METTENWKERATKGSRIKHFRQKHRLKFSDVKSGIPYDHCLVCHPWDILDPFYRCTAAGCDVLIHKSCSAIPADMQLHNHPFHSQHPLFLADLDVRPSSLNCNACGNYCSGIVYMCLDLECSFTLHVPCASLTPTKNSHPHPHPHPLILCDQNYDYNYAYKCTCCDLPFDGPSSLIYVCLECNALLDKSCAELPSKLEEHPFHPLHPLILFRRPHLPRKPPGFEYRCSQCNFYLDVPFASLKPSSSQNKEDQDHQFMHSHPLIFCDNKQKFPFPCHVCKLPLGDSLYFCPTCKALLHKSCADLPREIKHVFHPQHFLTFVNHPSTSLRSCEGCSSLINFDSFAFECSQCKFWLDVRCALSKPTTMMSKIHHHPLAFFDKPIYDLYCHTCGQHCHTPFFRCAWCKFNLHVYCISTLPLTIKSRHCHPLTLINSPIKDRPDEDDDAEFYCDACEKRRVLAHRSYYCDKCHYVAHPHCVIMEIKHILEEEWSQQESQRVADEVEEPPALILKDFLGSFKGDETKEAQGVFEDYRKGIHGDYYYNPINPLYNSIHGIYLGKATTQMVKMLVSKNEVTKMPWENWDSTSKVVKINNYTILEKLGPILEALFGKYGDFSGKSGLSRKAKMLYIMTVCDAVHSMCNTKVVDITTNLLVCWFHSLMLGHYAGFEIHFALHRLRRVVRAHFGLQANTIPLDPNFDPGVPPISLPMNFKKKLGVKEQDGETNELNEKVVSMKVVGTKLHEEIEELKKTLEEKCLLYIMWEECFDDAVALVEEMAGTSL